MGRSVVVAMAVAGLVGLGGVVGGVAVAATPSGSDLAPDRTLGPTTARVPHAGAVPTALPPSSVPPLGTAPVQPTALPPTSAWLATTTTAPPVTAPVTPAPTTISVVSPATVPPTDTVPPTVGVTSFDGFAFLTEVYAAAAEDPFTLLDIAERRTVLNTPAELFVAHLLAVTITHQLDLGLTAPTYTVTQDGKAVRVCMDGTKCDVFSDFYAPTGLLETFSINGLPLVTGAGLRRVNVESLSADSTLCRALSDGALSCVVLLTSEGAATALMWDQTTFTAADGRQFAPDLARSEFTPSIADGGVGSGHLVFPGAPVEGEIALPMISGLSGAQNVMTIPIREVS